MVFVCAEYLPYIATMFIREVKKQNAKKGKIFYQYCLVQALRENGKQKQKIILYLGSDPLMQNKKYRKSICQMLTAKIFEQTQAFELQAALFKNQADGAQILKLIELLYEKYLLKYPKGTADLMAKPSKAKKADFQEVNLNNLKAEHTTSFGAENLCNQVLERLQLNACLRKLGFNKAARNKAMMSIIARAIFIASEHKTADILENQSELKALFNYEETITHKQLYHISDKLYANKTAIELFIYQRIKTLFNLKDKILIFDISNTYFETSKRGSELAKHGGNSKEKRNDCPIVVFTAVINEQGFIKHSGIYKGNTTDGSLLKVIIEDLEAYAKANNEPLNQTIVLDAGIADEGNLTYLKGKEYNYVAVSRKKLKDYDEVDEQSKIVELTDRGKKEVKLKIIHPKTETDTFMYVESEDKRKKEESIDEKIGEKYVERLAEIKAALSKPRGTKRIEKVWERIGRAKEKYKRISAQYSLVLKNDGKNITDISWKKTPNKTQTDKSKGVYFIRTNLTTTDEQKLWKIYNTIREVEATFRCLKTDLNLRPVYHQNDERIESHIFLCLLAYQLVNTIRYQLKKQGIRHDWSKILRIMHQHRMQDIVLESKTKTIRVRKPSEPTELINKIYKATKTKANVKQYSKIVMYH